MFESPENKFQRHIANYFIREHQYALLEQDEITDTQGVKSAFDSCAS